MTQAAQETFAIPKSLPKYIGSLHAFIDRGLVAREREKTQYTFDAIAEKWPLFAETHRKKSRKRTKNEIEANKVDKYDKIFSQPNSMDVIQKCPSVCAALKKAAAEQKAILIKSPPPSKRRKTKDEEEEEQEEEEQQAEDDGEEAAADDAEQEEEEENDIEEEDSSEPFKDESEEQEKELKRSATPSVVKQEIASPPNRREKRKRRASLKHTIQEQIIPIEALEEIKKTFFHNLNAYSIPWDEEMATTFEKLYNVAVKQNKALESVNEIMDESEE